MRLHSKDPLRGKYRQPLIVDVVSLGEMNEGRVRELDLIR